MKTSFVSFIILLSITGYQFASWLANALANPSWLTFPTVPVVALGVVAFFVAVGLQVNSLWKQVELQKRIDLERLEEIAKGN